MSDAKYTPGPWKVEPSNWCVVVAPRREITVEGRSAEEALANTFLVGAAPDLLEALQAVLDTTEDPAFGAYHMAALEARRVAVLAIAKARGEGR